MFPVIGWGKNHHSQVWTVTVEFEKIIETKLKHVHTKKISSNIIQHLYNLRNTKLNQHRRSMKEEQLIKHWKIYYVR